MRISELVCCASVLLVSAARTAHAEPAPSAVELEAARKLFDEGVRQEEAGAWSTALETFRKVALVRSTAAVHFHLGLCLENLKKWVEARSEFLTAERLAKEKKDPNGIGERARAHAESLRGRIPTVILVPPATSATISVTIDGQPISNALLGAEIPIDPGSHRIEATAPGYRAFTRDIKIDERASDRVQLTLTPEPAAIDNKSAAPVSGTRFGALPWIVSGVAVVALSTSGVFYALRAREAAHLEGACSGMDCASSERDHYDRGRAFTTVGNVLLIVGAVAGASAITLFVLNHDTRATVAASARGVSFSMMF